MGLIKLKIIKFFTIYAIVFSVALSVFNTSAFASSLPYKTADPVIPGDVYPGSELKITIHVPGDTAKIRNPADIMLVMDRTGSMDDTWGSTSEQKIFSAINALNTFVLNTTEDKGVSNPGDYVGLVSYSATAARFNGDPLACRTRGVFDQFKCAGLDSPIANMTDGVPPPEPDNKAAITNQINAICPKNALGDYDCVGSTPIGAGMNLANKELLNQIDKPGGPPSSSRNGVRKYMVLATDGCQNTYPSPYDLNILQTAINNGIMVFTVGMGNRDNGNRTCDDGEIDEVLLKDIACRTDTAVLNPDEFCRAGNPSNNPSSPRNFFVADNPAALTSIYEEIQNRISRDFWFMVLDYLRGDLIDYRYSVTEANINANGGVYDCAEPTKKFDYELVIAEGNLLLILIKDIPKDTWACITFIARVRADFNPRNFERPWPVDFMLSWVNPWDPGLSCDENGNGVIETEPEGDSEADHCIARMSGRQQIPINNTSVTVRSPGQPWLKTTGGDVGVRGNINVKRDLTAVGQSNAEYLVIMTGNNINATGIFTSAKQWLIPFYPTAASPSIDLPPFSPTPASAMYQALLDKYSKRCQRPLSGPTPSDIDSAVTTDCNILVFSGGDFDINAADWGTYTGKPAIIFIPGTANKLNINTNLMTDPTTGLIFVVQGGIQVSAGVGQMNGVFITDGEFNSGGAGCGVNGPAGKLLINGAVYAFGQACFTRSLPNNLNDPAELINFEPKYLWLFREIIGNSKVVYREVAP